MVLRIIVDLIELYLLILFLRIILTWFPIEPWSKMARVQRTLGAVTDPLLSRVRRLVPSARVGGMGLDLSPMIVFVVGVILIRLL